MCSRQHSFCKVTCNMDLYEQRLLSQFDRETLGARKQNCYKPKETNNRANISSQGSEKAGSTPEEGVEFHTLGLF